jgi:hypothetical protein
MKTSLKHFIICFLMAGSMTSHAQSFTSKGTVELGGEFSFSSQKESSSNNYSHGQESEAYNVLMFNPYIGAMVGQGFELGFMPGIARSGSITSLNLFFAPSYNINTSGNAYPYLEGLIGYSSIASGVSANGLGTGISGGVKVAIGSSGLFLFNVKYLHQSFETEESYNTGYPYYSYTTVKTTVAINTIFAGMGFRIFITSKPAKTPALKVK